MEEIEKQIYYAKGPKWQYIEFLIHINEEGKFGYGYLLMAKMGGCATPAFKFYDTEKQALERGLISIKRNILQHFGEMHKLTKDFMEWADKQNNTQQSLFNP